MQNPAADLLLPSVQSPTFLRATLSGPHRLDKNSPLQKVTIRPIELHGTRHLQVSRFDARKDFTQNILPSEAHTALADILAIGFANLHLTTADEEIDVRLTKKLDLSVSRKKRTDTQLPAVEPHNRAKNLPLPEGHSDRLLQVMGIMTDTAQIKPTMRAKFTQINEFLKLLDPLLDPLLDSLPASTNTPITILDAGSGSAYLTLALHHYLTHIRKIPATILGIDVNDELIEKSTRKAHQLDAHNLTFTAAPIAHAGTTADIVLALHACDTATDDAIAHAITTNAKILLAVPCCHKNLNDKLHLPVLAPLHRHGILHHRLADLLTDTFRAQILRIMGYKTDVIEFISPEHTARNLMIRAIKTTSPGDKQFLTEYHALKDFTNVTPYLETRLGRVLTSNW